MILLIENANYSDIITGNYNTPIQQEEFSGQPTFIPIQIRPAILLHTRQ